ncbi:MAG: AAA family ATPase [Saprospiraceae bacterium]
MKIIRIIIQNFRGIKDAVLHFEGHTVLVGDNNVGKSTIFEAINLVLGPDRISSPNPINEHDFYASSYIDNDGNLKKIYIEVVIGNLSEEQKRYFKSNLEYWDNNAKVIINEPPIEAIESDDVEETLRVCFEGSYNIEDDDFEGRTYYCSPVETEDGSKIQFWKNDKRKCGFLYLRALRTGSRALSMESGSLLDIILRLKEVRPKIWEDVITQLSGVSVANDPDLGVSGILTSLQKAIKEFIPLEWGANPHLRVSNLTREHLRKTLTVFMATGVKNGEDAHFAPYTSLGTGTINMLVLALLSMIADEKNTVIFAMEEPETAIPPYTQKRIIDTVRKKSSQAFFTTHSPFVLEEFEPENILVLKRDNGGNLSGVPFSFPDIIKPKAFSLEFRKRFAEALLARRVLIAEGKTETLAYPIAAKRLSQLSHEVYQSLDSLGIAVFNAETDSQVEASADLFKRLGKRVYAVFDNQEDKKVSERIKAVTDIAFESPYKGFEDLLLNETQESALRRFVSTSIAQGNWPQHLYNRIPTEASPLEDVKTSLKELFKWAKGRGDVKLLLWESTLEEMPETIKDVILKLTKDVYPNEQE